MSPLKRTLIFFVLPIIAWISYPLSRLNQASVISLVVLLALVIVLFVSLGFAVLKGRSLALTLSIFLQGLNVIIRLMMLFPNAYKYGAYDLPYIFTNLLGMGISFYLMLRLDRTDVRVMMVT
jgi:hypothetical protein